MLTFLAESLQHDEYHHCISRRQASAVMEDFEVVVYRHRRRKWMTSRLLSRAGPFGVWSLEDGSTRTCTRTRRNAAINQANDAALSTFTEISMAEESSLLRLVCRCSIFRGAARQERAGGGDIQLAFVPRKWPPLWSRQGSFSLSGAASKRPPLPIHP